MDKELKKKIYLLIGLECSWGGFLAITIILFGVIADLLVIMLVVIGVTPIAIFEEELGLGYLHMDKDPAGTYYDSEMLQSEIRQILKENDLQPSIKALLNPKSQNHQLSTALSFHNSTQSIQVKLLGPHLPDLEVIGWCSVCNFQIFTNEEILYCPICGTAAHRAHLLEWIKIKGYCPHCGYLLKRMS